MHPSCEDARVSRPDVILIDLDGTITDSIPGIFRCLRLALPVLGMEAISDEELQTWLGPPLRHTLLERYDRTEGDLDAFVAEYRAHYFGGGEYEFEVFPGMAGIIADIATTHTRLVLATAKPIESAERVLTRAGLIGLFDFVSGTELDLMRQDKPSVIAHGVAGVGLDPATVDAVMVGDRKEDVLGGQHFGYRTVGLRWGYADPGELEAVGATHLVDPADELRAVLGLNPDTLEDQA
jgi:phosphoglycolate phosphatase